MIRDPLRTDPNQHFGDVGGVDNLAIAHETSERCFKLREGSLPLPSLEQCLRESTAQCPILRTFGDGRSQFIATGRGDDVRFRGNCGDRQRWRHSDRVTRIVDETFIEQFIGGRIRDVVHRPRLVDGRFNEIRRYIRGRLTRSGANRFVFIAQFPLDITGRFTFSVGFDTAINIGS